MKAPAQYCGGRARGESPQPLQAYQTSRNWHGFSGGALYSPGQGDALRAGGHVASVAAGYAQVGFHIGVGMLFAEDPNFSFFGTNRNANGPQSDNPSNFTGPIASGYMSAKAQRILAAGAAWQKGSSTFGVVVSTVKFSDLGFEPGIQLNPRGFSFGAATIKNIELNDAWRVSPRLLLGVASHLTSTTDPANAAGARYRQQNAGMDFVLSPRTDLYGAVVHQIASGTDSTGRPATAAISSLATATGASQTAVTIGIRVRF